MVIEQEIEHKFEVDMYENERKKDEKNDILERYNL